MPDMKRARITCFVVLSGIAIACLWPFHAPANHVAWRRVGRGIHLGGHGSVVSATAFGQANSIDKTVGTLELSIEPDTATGRSTILSFDSRLHSGASFLLEQNGNSLFVQRHNGASSGSCCTAYFGVPNSFQPGKPVVLTVVLTAHDTSVYIDGALAKTSTVFGSSGYNLTGTLVVGNSSVADNSWSGTILGLAVYDSSLPASEVKEHAQEWGRGNSPTFTADQFPVALYQFDEHAGTVANNSLDRATNLLIPGRYFVLHPRFLTPIWERYRFGLPKWSYWQDGILNIGGFVPAGLALMNYFKIVRGGRCPALATMLLAFVFSLTMECLQWFLPTRDSDMTDVLTNTIGAALGASLNGLRPLRGRMGWLSE